MACIPASQPGPDDVPMGGNDCCRLYGEFQPGTNVLIAVRCENNLGGNATFSLYTKQGALVASRTFPPFATTREVLSQPYDLGKDRELGSQFNIRASLPIP